jgi:hypothetical protein
MEAPAMKNESRPRRQHRDQPRAEPESLAEIDGGGLLREHRIGSGFDSEAVDVLGADDPTGAPRRLEYLEWDAALRQLERGCEPGDSAADDGNHAFDSTRERRSS